MSKKTHLKSLQSTLRENSYKAKKLTKEFVYWVLCFALSMLFVSFFYPQHIWLFYITSIGLLVTATYYFKIINNCWQTNKKIKQKIQQLYKEPSL